MHRERAVAGAGRTARSHPARTDPNASAVDRTTETVHDLAGEDLSRVDDDLDLLVPGEHELRRRHAVVRLHFESILTHRERRELELSIAGALGAQTAPPLVATAAVDTPPEAQRQARPVDRHLVDGPLDRSRDPQSGVDADLDPLRLARPHVHAAQVRRSVLLRLHSQAVVTARQTDEAEVPLRVGSHLGAAAQPVVPLSADAIVTLDPDSRALHAVSVRVADHPAELSARLEHHLQKRIERRVMHHLHLRPRRRGDAHSVEAIGETGETKLPAGVGHDRIRGELDQEREEIGEPDEGVRLVVVALLEEGEDFDLGAGDRLPRRRGHASGESHPDLELDARRRPVRFDEFEEFADGERGGGAAADPTATSSRDEIPAGGDAAEAELGLVRGELDTLDDVDTITPLAAKLRVVGWGEKRVQRHAPLRRDLRERGPSRLGGVRITNAAEEHPDRLGLRAEHVADNLAVILHHDIDRVRDRRSVGGDGRTPRRV